MMLTVDSQEAPARKTMLQRIAARLELDYQVAQTIADVSVGTTFGAELKKPSDFIASIKDRRIFHQALALRENYERYAIIVEGTLSDVLFASRGMSQASVMGAIYSLALRYGVPVQFTHPLKSGRIEFHLDAAIRAGIKDGTAGSSLVRRKSTPQDHRLALLTSLPGIGVENATNILAVYGNPHDALQNIPQWKDIPGIGPKTISKCYTFFTTGEIP